MKKLLWLVVVLTFGAFLSILAYALTFGSTTIALNLINSTKVNNPLNNDIFDGYFEIHKVRYYERGLAEPDFSSNGTYDICSQNMTYEIVILELLLNNDKLPEKCEIFIDGRYSDRFDVMPPPCHPMCSSFETLTTYSLERQDIYGDHEIEICCEGICHDKKLMAVCIQKS